MAIPGRKLDRVETRNKVRVGIKVNGQPRSVDYFVSEDAEFNDLCRGEPRELAVTLPYATADECFSTGLEWWKGQLLACYTHDGSSDPVALRVQGMKVKGSTLNMLDADDTLRGDPLPTGRQPITCRGDACPHFGKKANNRECRPMGRLQFFLVGSSRTDTCLQFDTKAWGTIENLAGTLGAAARSGPLNAPGREFILTVAWESKGRDRWPVVSVREATVAPLDARAKLAALLDERMPDWRTREDVIARIKEVGPEAALAAMTAEAA